ncbi:phage tail protein [Cronobacter sakazakii]
MNRTDAPKKQPVPFGVNGPREDLLPTTPAGDNTASYDAGFPPVTMILKSAGGLPPKGQDMNQILFELSSICRWFTAGALNEFDATFASSIGGYPKASVLVGDDGTTIYISTIDANSNNPNSVTTGWLNLSKITAIAALSGGANKLPYFSGANTAAQTDLTDIGRNIIGKGSIADVLSYLGLGEGSALPVGVPVPYPLAVPPAGWMKCNGSPFNLTSYPALAAVFPSGVLPDLRGEFIRGWDDGRGIDSGRALLSAQQGSLMALSVSANTDDDRISIMHIYSPPSYEALISGVGMDSMNGYQKVFGVNKLSSTLTAPDTTSPLGTTVTGNPAVGGVARPRNVSFNYIVRAA